MTFGSELRCAPLCSAAAGLCSVLRRRGAVPVFHCVPSPRSLPSRATQYTCMLLSYLIERKADKEALVMKLKQLESSMSSGRKSKYLLSTGTSPFSLAPSSNTAAGPGLAQSRHMLTEQPRDFVPASARQAGHGHADLCDCSASSLLGNVNRPGRARGVNGQAAALRLQRAGCQQGTPRSQGARLSWCTPGSLSN